MRTQALSRACLVAQAVGFMTPISGGPTLGGATLRAGDWRLAAEACAHRTMRVAGSDPPARREDDGDYEELTPNIDDVHSPMSSAAVSMASSPAMHAFRSSQAPAGGPFPRASAAGPKAFSFTPTPAGDSPLSTTGWCRPAAGGAPGICMHVAWCSAVAAVMIAARTHCPSCA